MDFSLLSPFFVYMWYLPIIWPSLHSDIRGIAECSFCRLVFTFPKNFFKFGLLAKLERFLASFRFLVVLHSQTKRSISYCSSIFLM